MRVDVVSIFPDVFQPVLASSMLGIAQERGLLDVRLHDLRDWTEGVHRQVDDYAYGGGPGMVMKPEPFFRAVAKLKSEAPGECTVVLMTPQGRRFDQRAAEDLAQRDHLIFLCGRYEGFDERIRSLADLQLSIGDYVLTGGELPAMVVIDAVSRLIPGVLGHEDSAAEESFSWGLLEYPQYTRPPVWEGMSVPDVLLSGDHARVDAWRRRQAVARTAALRPDLLETADLTPGEREFASAAAQETETGEAGEGDS
ncbi:MAG TPA: tRNA (guanosine(37)-N1)-methyltransferase TrmD [Coriobacteriia bacterium]